MGPYGMFGKGTFDESKVNRQRDGKFGFRARDEADLSGLDLMADSGPDAGPLKGLDPLRLPRDAKTFTAAPDPTDPAFPGRARLNVLRYRPHEYVTPKIAGRINAGGTKNVDPTWQDRWSEETQWANGDLPVVVDTDHGPRPLNPAGRTGLTGLGGCKRLGENKAADPVITRTDPETGRVQILLAYKSTEDQWCLPGGTVDEGESAAQACTRELEEEVGLRVDMAAGQVLYRGYVDDARNTDNAWFSTEARHVHLTGPVALQEPVASDDVSAARWVDVDSIKPGDLFASHGHIIEPLLPLR